MSDLKRIQPDPANMRGLQRHALVLWLFCTGAGCLGAQPYPAVAPLQRAFDVPDVRKADVSFEINSPKGEPLYKLQCHSASYNPDPGAFEYSGDFECQLGSNSPAVPDWGYSTLLTEDAHQSRDWESRGRFFAAELQGACARIPEFGTTRSFRLRGVRLTLEVTDPVFTAAGELKSLKLTVTVRPDVQARRRIAEIVPFPKTQAANDCKLRERFVDFVEVAKSHRERPAR